MERVDKRWHEKGLDAYSTAAILGTLRHYGAAVDEAGFRALAEADFPLGIAKRWHEGWTGTGQFSRFPAAAAEELWHRLLEGAIAPTDLALAIINLLRTLDEQLSGKPDNTLDTRFKVVEAYLPKVPAEAERRSRFVAELSAVLGEWMGVLDRMAEALVAKGLTAEAERVVAFEEALIPERKGVASALVQAARGERDPALESLRALAKDAGNLDLHRLAAVDALFELGDVDVGRAVCLALLDKAQAQKSVELGAEVVGRLQKLLDKNRSAAGLRELRDRIEAFIVAVKTEA